MLVDTRQAARVVEAVTALHPHRRGVAVDWDPPGGGGWIAWSRYALGSFSGTRWPEGVCGDFAVVALNKVRQATSLALAAAAACLRDDGALYLFGQNDLGIRSVKEFREVGFETVDVGARGRLLRWRGRVDRREEGLETFRCVGSLEIPSAGRVDWIDYPGCFAEGRVDAGTALLLESLDDVPALGGPVYDFACGTGVISRSVRGRWPKSTVFGSDADAIAVHAARQNVLDGQFVVADGWGYPVNQPPQLVLSNPPFHFGKARDHRACFDFIEQAGRRLAPDGDLRIVVQREVPAEPVLRSSFREVRRVAAASGYVVWGARGPMRVGVRP
jgi:16S rRNA (guanine1207-N2)-methyltransferase